MEEVLSGNQRPEDFPSALHWDFFEITLSTEVFTEKELNFISKKMLRAVRHPDGSYMFTFIKTERNEQDGSIYNDVIRFHNTTHDCVVKTLKESVFDNAWLSDVDSADSGPN